MNNNRTVFFAIGVLLIILGTFMLIPFFVQWIHDEKNSTFLSSSSITIFIGILLVLSNQEENKKLNFVDINKYGFPYNIEFNPVKKYAK